MCPTEKGRIQCVHTRTKRNNYDTPTKKINIIYLDFIHDKPTRHGTNQLRITLEIRFQIRK